MTRHLLRDDDLTQAEQTEILDLAEQIKADRWGRTPLAGPQTVAVIFDKSSTRTRVSFAVGIADLGGIPLIISTASAERIRPIRRVITLMPVLPRKRAIGSAAMKQSAAAAAMMTP